MKYQIGSKIKVTLRRRGITQKAFSDRLGIPSSSLSAYLNDKREIPFVIVTRMAKELHLDLNAMFDIDADNTLQSEAEETIMQAFRKVKETEKTNVAKLVVGLLDQINKN